LLDTKLDQQITARCIHVWPSGTVVTGARGSISLQQLKQIFPVLSSFFFFSVYFSFSIFLFPVSFRGAFFLNLAVEGLGIAVSSFCGVCRLFWDIMGLKRICQQATKKEKVGITKSSQ